MTDQIAPRLRAAREALQLSRRELASRAKLDVSAIGRLETGKRAGSSIATRRQIARAFGVSVETLEQYLEGSIDLEAFQRERARSVVATPTTRNAFDDALASAFDGRTHRLAHLDAVRSILSRVDTSRVPTEQAERIARRMLDAAAALPANEAITCESLLLAIAALNVPGGAPPAGRIDR
jgi:transcriptional regulator with XRE-family HTH domain